MRERQQPRCAPCEQQKLARIFSNEELELNMEYHDNTSSGRVIIASFCIKSLLAQCC